MMPLTDSNGADLNKMVIVLVDRNGVIQYWSEGAEAAFGFPASDAAGQDLDLIVPAEYRQDHWKGFHRAVEAGSAFLDGKVVPFPVQMASGGQVTTPGRLMLIRCPRGQVIGAVVAFDAFSAEPQRPLGDVER